MVPSPSPPLEDSDNDTEVFESDQELLLDIDDDFSDVEKQSSSRQVLRDSDREPIAKGSQNIYVGEAKLTPPPINKRAHKEIRLKDLNSHNYELFKQAIQKEWRTNINNGAIAVVPPHEAQKIRQHSSNRIMQSRLLHVAKPIDDMTQVDASSVLQCSSVGVPSKAKSRWVARGDKDPDIFNVCISSPVIHRDTFMMGLQAICSKQWRVHFADFSHDPICSKGHLFRFLCACFQWLPSGKCMVR